MLVRFVSEVIPHPMSQDTVFQEHCLSGPRPPGLLDQVRAAIRRLDYSRRTEEAYVHWIKRYIFFHGKRHPNELGEAEATAFLSHLAVERKVAAATQAQALAALLFLYKQVLGRDLGWLDGMTRAKRPVRLPTVLSAEEVQALLVEPLRAHLLEVRRLHQRDPRSPLDADGLDSPARVGQPRAA